MLAVVSPGKFEAHRRRYMIGARWLPVLVRGVGDVGSGAAAALFHGGYAIALNGEPAAATLRSGMAFADAAIDDATNLGMLVVLLPQKSPKSF
jgi:hypothetical protein